MVELINLFFVCNDHAIVDNTINVDVMLVAQETQQRITSVDLVFGWDNTKLEFIGIDNTGAMDSLMSFVPESGSNWDFYGINEATPPADGNGLYYWLAPLDGIPYYISNPVKITTLQFKVLPDFSGTLVDVIPEMTVNATARTIIYGSNIPGLVVTGMTTGFVVDGIPGDINYSGRVDSGDMAMLLGNWGVVSFTNNPCDLNEDGIVDSIDLGILLSNWS